jgi:hypothetical protein
VDARRWLLSEGKSSWCDKPVLTGKVGEIHSCLLRFPADSEGDAANVSVRFF